MDEKIYRASPSSFDTTFYRYHREHRRCKGVYSSANIVRPWLCPGCHGRYQGSAITRARRRFRNWLMLP